MNTALQQEWAQRRQRCLAAMGITLYRLRTSASSERADHEDRHAECGVPATLVIVCTQMLQEGIAESILRALDIDANAVHWLYMNKDSLSTLPKNSTAYLLLGADLARTIGAELPTETQRKATIVVANVPYQWRANALAKRQWWQALRPLARALRAQSF